MMRYLVVTKGLANVIEATGSAELNRALAKLKKMGYKKPMVYVRQQCFTKN